MTHTQYCVMCMENSCPSQLSLAILPWVCLFDEHQWKAGTNTGTVCNTQAPYPLYCSA